MVIAVLYVDDRHLSQQHSLCRLLSGQPLEQQFIASSQNEIPRQYVQAGDGVLS
jgi:hypothetical protein